jgi:hypothetical protein
MSSRTARLLRAAWVTWLRFEFRVLAVLLPTICLELALVNTIIAHLPLYVGLLGALPALLARDVWRFAGEIRFGEPRAT